MNKRELLAFMARNGDNQQRLAEAIGIGRGSLNKKMNETHGAYFTQREILAIKERYKLTAEEIDRIFFTPIVSQ